MENVPMWIPMPIQVVVDDVGWWSGEDGHQRGEPYRTGIPRNHDPRDYAAIVSLGRQLDMRPQAAMVLCEWDRENLLRRVPSSQWMGAEWDNSRWQGPWLDEAADVIRNGRQHMELALHGVGHEFWEDGAMSRAEWHDRDRRMRPRLDVVAHLEAFAGLMEQHDLGPFPESFVPAAFLHCFGDPEANLAEILHTFGIRYVSTPFSSMGQARAVEHPLMGFDHGVATIDRGTDLLKWHELGTVPENAVPRGPICGMHWPALLHRDPARNEDVVSQWVSLLERWDRQPDFTLARSTRQMMQQLGYYLTTRTWERRGHVTLDMEASPPALSGCTGTDLVLKVMLPTGVHFNGVGLDIRRVSAVESRAESSYIYTLEICTCENAGIGDLFWS